MVDEIIRLQTIVDKLPKTADGVPVVPGMILWPGIFIPDEQGARIGWYATDLATGDRIHQGEDTLRIGKCYSTREAAETANRIPKGGALGGAPDSTD
jgi:hypothetical protein